MTKSGAVLAWKNGQNRAAVRLEVLGASGNGTITGEAPTRSHSNYFHGSDPSKWVTGAAHFEKVRVSQIKDGIDFLCYANQKRFEYDLIVRPGARPSDVRLRFAGAEKLELTTEGDLSIQTAVGTLTQHKPHIWQRAGTERETIAGRYEVAENGEVSVVVGPYDHNRELVIDPVVTYSTFLGGTFSDQALAIAVDASRNVYVTGSTASVNFPTTVGAYSVAEKSTSTDVFVSKLNPSGTALLYSTYIGGANTDIANAIAVDAAGNAYITGSTQSSDYPTTTGAFQITRKASNQDVFVTKINPAGSALVYSTYLSGTNTQIGYGIQVDSSGNAYVAGSTGSSNFPTTTGAYTTVAPGNNGAAFVAKINPTGTQLVYSTFLGGGSGDSASAIVLDGSNNAYVAGAAGLNFPTTIGAYQTTNKSGSYQNGFVAEISADGSKLVASTLLGASATSTYYNQSAALALAMDSSANVYVTGNTYSPTFPTTVNAFSGAPSSCYYCFYPHAFVSKMNSALTSLTYSTYLGGSNSDYGTGITVDSGGNAYVTGYTTSGDFPITPGSLLARKNPANQSIFMTQFDPTGAFLTYSTIFGGTGQEVGTGIAVDPTLGVYLSGYTTSSDFPTTSGVLQAVSTNSNSSSYDGFVLKLDLSSQTSCTVALSPSGYSAPLGGGQASLAITTPAGCPWVLYNPSSSLTITGPTSGFGNATANFSVSSNAGSSNNVSVNLLAGSSTFAVTQPAGSCSTPLLAPTSANFATVGGLDKFSIAVPGGCPFTAKNSAPWITVTGGSPGNGSGNITYFVDRNDFANRSGSLLVDGVSFSITQAGAGCTASAAVTSGTGGAGGTGYISLTTSANSCVWKAYSSAAWVQLASTGGTGSGTTGITVAPNPGTISRTAQVLIAGQIVVVSQAAGPFGNPSGYTISTIAGTGIGGFSGDGGPATSASLYSPSGIAYDAAGNLYIADSYNYRVRKVAPDGTISTFAGNGSSVESGNGGPPTAAGIYQPTSVAIGTSGEVYVVASTGSLRKIVNGTISALASSVYPYSLATDSANNVYVSGQQIIQRVTPAGAVTTFAGSLTTNTFSGDGGAPTAAGLNYVEGIAFDNASNLYLSDTYDERIRRISGNVITTVAGTGGYGFNGDGVATSSTLYSPTGLIADPVGNIFVADDGNTRVRRLTPGGNLTTIAGNGSTYYNYTAASNGDGGPALSASFESLRALAMDSSGNIAVADNQNAVIRLLTPTYSFCSFALSSTGLTAPLAGGSASPAVTTATGCVWNTFTNVPWITVVLSTGTGSGTAALQIAANNTGGGRTGIVSIGGQTFTVTQLGGPTVVIDAPTPNTAIGFSNFTVTGWALDNVSAIGTAITSAQVLVDGVLNGTATYGVGRVDVCTAYPGRPGCPNVGFTYSVNLTGLALGSHTLTVNATNSSTPPLTGSASVPFRLVAAPSVGTVIPSSASGVSQVFTATYADTGGGANLNRRLMLINATLNGAGACYLQADPSGIYLVNDAGSGLLGPLTGSGTLANSQCTLNGSGTSLVNSGNISTLTASVLFKPLFAGTKAIYLFADDSVTGTGFSNLGTFTVNGGVPGTASVSPTAGSGANQTFTAVYTEPAGATFLNRRLLLINSSLSGAGACFVQADPTGIYLVNDAGASLLGPVTTGSTIANSQCTLNGTGTSLTNTGVTSTLAVSVTFKTAFAGAKNVYMYADDAFGNNTGFQSPGTFSVSFGAPTADSVTPSAAGGTAQVFTAVYSDPSGATVFNRRLFVVNSVLNGAGACFVQTDPTGIYLVNDAGSGLLGPLTGSATLTNNQCTLNGSGSGVVNSGNSSTVTLSLVFKPAFGGTKNIYMYADDTNGNSSGFQNRGTFTVAFAVPTADSATPSAGSGTTQTFTAVYSDGSGAVALNRRLFLINGSLNGAGACFIQADPTGLYLVNDAGSALLGPVVPGGTAANNQCTLNGTGSSVINAGNSSTVTLSIAFKVAFAGAKTLYMYAEDSSGNNSGFQNRGTYTVSGTPSVPTATSVTPSSGSGASQTFTAVYSDAAGNSLLTRRLFLINSTLNGAAACLVEVDPNGIFLASDTAGTLIGPVLSTTSLNNSQCTLSGAGASVAYSGTSTTVVLPLTFKAGFGGSRNIYMYVDDTSGNNSGWQLMGSITTQ